MSVVALLQMPALKMSGCILSLYFIYISSRRSLFMLVLAIRVDVLSAGVQGSLFRNRMPPFCAKTLDQVFKKMRLPCELLESIVYTKKKMPPPC